MKKRQVWLVALTLACPVLFFCRGPNEPKPLRSPELEGPVVTGIYHTIEFGPETVGVWGKPSDHLSDGGLRLFPPYPNPFNPCCAIRFQLGSFSPGEASTDPSIEVKMWVVPAILPGNSNEASTLAAGIVRPISGSSIRTLVDGIKNPGMYQVVWDEKDEQGNSLPNGFYRIYLEGNGVLLWTDALMLSIEKPIPPDIKSFVLPYLAGHEEDLFL